MKGQETDSKTAERCFAHSTFCWNPLFNQHAKTIATYLSLPHEFRHGAFYQTKHKHGKWIVILEDLSSWVAGFVGL